MEIIKHLLGHSTALDMPAWSTLTPGTLPEWFSGFATLPQSEIYLILFLFAVHIREFTWNKVLIITNRLLINKWLSVLIIIAETVIIFTMSRSRFYESLVWSRILDSVYKSLIRSRVGKYYLEHNQDNRYDCQIKLIQDMKAEGDQLG